MVSEIKYFNGNEKLPQNFLQQSNRYFSASFIYMFKITYMLKYLAESEL